MRNGPIRKAGWPKEEKEGEKEAEKEAMRQKTIHHLLDLNISLEQIAQVVERDVEYVKSVIEQNQPQN